MNTIKQSAQNRKPEIDLAEFRRLVFLHAPALGLLLDQLEAGILQEPLEVMIAISQCVSYFTESGPQQDFPAQQGEICPGRYCPLC